MRPSDDCPCGSTAPYGCCCLPLHVGDGQPETAVQLMRARYSAYAVGALDYLWRTWHPRTRPEALRPDPGVTWTTLELLDVEAGAEGDDRGEVEFRAFFRTDSGEGILHERSRFALRARRWFYVDGTILS